MNEMSRWTYSKILVLWVFGLLGTTIATVLAAVTVGFSDNEGMNGAAAWPAAVFVSCACLGGLTHATVKLIRTDHRRGGAVSAPGVAVSILATLLAFGLLVGSCIS